MPNLHQSGLDLSGLVEVLDQAEKPLCLLPFADAAGQGLRFHTVAVQIMTPSGALLLSEKTTGQFDITFMAPLAPGLALAEFAQSLLALLPGPAGEPRLVARLEPGPVHLFYAACSDALLVATMPSDYLAASRPEIRKLQEHGLIAPFLLKILPLLP